MRDKGTPFIHTENLWFSYNGDEDTERIPIIRGISIDIEEGSFVAILGHNGSGKSTFAKLLNMILTPDSGKICIDGKDITDGELSEEEIMELRRNIGMVFQNPDNQLVATIVEEDVAFGPENMGIPPAEIRERVDNALKTGCNDRICPPFSASAFGRTKAAGRDCRSHRNDAKVHNL